MGNLVKIKENIKEMTELVLSMLKTTFEGFMKHEPDILAGVLKDELRLNDMEKAITLSLIDISKTGVNAVDKKNIVLMTNMVADLEEIGDYIKDMIERIEIKIQEKLFFSDEALDEYKHLYGVIEDALSDIDKSLRMDDNGFSQKVVADKEHVDGLIQKFRNNHAERLMSGECDPRAGNMFLNLLDFTGQIFHHAKSIAKSILELRWT